MTIPGHADWDVAAGDFTFETWFKAGDTQNTFPIFSPGNGGGSGNSAWVIEWFYDSSQGGSYKIRLRYSQGASDGTVFSSEITSASDYANATWHHIAVVRSGNNFYSFINGTQYGTTTAYTSALSYTITDLLHIGGYSIDGTVSDATSLFYLDDLRFTKGKDRYTSNFTPPTQLGTGTNTGSRYYLDGVEAPTLQLFPGFTYKFDTSDATNATHDFAFTTNQSSKYTTGVTETGTDGAAGSELEWEVPVSVPTTMYYYCSLHAGMGGNVATSPGGATGDVGPAGSSGLSPQEGIHFTSGTSGSSGRIGDPGTSGTSGTAGLSFGTSGTSATGGTSGADGGGVSTGMAIAMAIVFG